VRFTLFLRRRYRVRIAKETKGFTPKVDELYDPGLIEEIRRETAGLTRGEVYLDWG
jgi:hypothetical protein